MEHPLPITLGLFWIGLIAVAIFWIGMRVYGSRRSALILMAISTAGFIAGAVVHPFTGSAGPPAIADPDPSAATPVASAAPAASASVAKPLRNFLLNANDESTVAALTANAQPPQGSIDEIGYTDAGGNFMQPHPLVVPPGSSLLVRGWALVPTTKAPAAAVFAVIDGSRRLGGDYQIGVSRPDVARALNNAAADRSGFSMLLRTAGLSTGPHHLQLGVSDGKEAFTLAASIDFSMQ